MIYYYIQSHGSSRTQRDWLVKRLDHAGNTLLLMHDGPAGDEMHITPPATAYARLDQRRSRSITYCGYSQVEVLIDAMRIALESPEPWEHFINLSAVCTPLKSQAEIAATLKSRARHGISDFAFVFRGGRMARAREAGTVHDIAYEKVAIPRPVVFADPAIRDVFTDPQRFPQTNTAMRASVHVHDLDGARTLYVRAPTRHENDERARYFARFPYHCGRAWYILSRRTCEMAVAEFGSAASWHRAIHASFYAPDESAIVSWLANHDTLRPSIDLTDNYRFRMGPPLQLSEALLPELAKSHALFARKRPPELGATFEAALLGLMGEAPERRQTR